MPRRRLISGGRFLPRSQPVESVEGGLVQVASTNLAADVTTAVAHPVYSTLISTTITTIGALAFLDILFYCSFDWTGFAGSRATSFRMRLDGVLIAPSRAADDNNNADLNQGVAINRRVGVVAGLHTVLVEWTKFGTGTLQCLPVTRPNQHGAHLKLEEQSV